MRPYRCGTRFGSTWIVHNDRSSKARVVVDNGQLKSGLLEPSIWVPLTSSLYACTSTNAGSPCTLASSIFMWARERGERLRVMSVCICVCVLSERSLRHAASCPVSLGSLVSQSLCALCPSYAPVRAPQWERARQGQVRCAARLRYRYCQRQLGCA